MDSDPHALSEMFSPVIQKPLQSQSYLLDSDTHVNGRTEGPPPKATGRARSASHSDSFTTLDPDPAASLHQITRTLSTPARPSAPKLPPKARRGLFSLLAAAAQPPPAPPKSEPATSGELNAVKDPTASVAPPTFMQNLARRLSGSSNKKLPVEIKNQAPQCARRTLNVNYARPRIEIKELEKIQLRRVGFVADETLISRRLFNAAEPFERELPPENKLKIRDLKDCYNRSCRNRELIPDDRIVRVFAETKGTELRTLDLSFIRFELREDVLPVCDVLSLVKGLEEIVLDNCDLTDEQLRLLLSSLLCLKRRPEDSEADHGRGIARFSIAGNTALTIMGWRYLACFVHMNADLVSLNISNIPLSVEAATILARAIALPNPFRREIPPEFRLQPIAPRQRQRKFSFRKPIAISVGADLTRTTSPNSKRQRPANDETAIVEEKTENEDDAGPELPDITPHSPLSATFVTAMPSTDSSSIVVVEPPLETKEGQQKPPPQRRKVEELKMNNCAISTEILGLFLSAVTNGGVRFWDIGGNKFGIEGMEMIATLFMEIKPEPKSWAKHEPKPETKDIETDGRASPTPVSSVASVPISTPSLRLEEPAAPLFPKLEALGLEGTDLSTNQLDPLLDVWLNHPSPSLLPLLALDLSNCRLGKETKMFNRLFAALAQFPDFRVALLSRNPLFANPGMIKVFREWLPRLPLLRRLDLVSTGLEAQHLVELAQILPDVKLLTALDIKDNPIYEMNDVDEEREGQTEDISGLTALEAATRYCRQLIQVELPEGGGIEAAHLRHKIFLRCFKNIELLDHLAQSYVTEDPFESGLGSRKRANPEEMREPPQQPTKEGRDKFDMCRGHGIAKALETVLLNTQHEDKAQDMSLDLLYRARKIKERLQPALLKGHQDEATKRRLNFLNQVLTKVIGRFEAAFPECRHAHLKPKERDEPASSDEEIEWEDTESAPSPAHLRRSSSMSEIARGLELEEGDVHRIGSVMRKRNILETELTGEQLLEAFLKVDKETVEREVWDKDGLHKVLRTSSQSPGAVVAANPVGAVTGGRVALEAIAFSNKDKDSDSHSI